MGCYWPELRRWLGSEPLRESPEPYKLTLWAKGRDYDGGSTSISLAEVTEVVKEPHSDKAPGISKFQMLKALGVEVLSWMTRLFNIAWTSETEHK